MKTGVFQEELAARLLEMVVSELRELLEELARTGELPAPGEEVAIEASSPVFDVSGFLLWTLAGLRLFHREGLPSVQTATGRVRHLLLLLAQFRCHGNITHMAAMLGSSRRAVREALRRHGLYSPSAPNEGAKPEVEIRPATVSMQPGEDALGTEDEPSSAEAPAPLLHAYLAEVPDDE